MGQIEILKKLNIELEKDIYDECQVIFILSRIRKYLEMQNLKNKFKYLNFYCNWALHSKIDRTERIADVLREFIKGKDREKFLTFTHLKKDLEIFLNAFSLSTKIIYDNDNYLRFINLLVDIYSETPLEVYPEEKRVIIIRKPHDKIMNSSFSISYEIH